MQKVPVEEAEKQSDPGSAAEVNKDEEKCQQDNPHDVAQTDDSNAGDLRPPSWITVHQVSP